MEYNSNIKIKSKSYIDNNDMQSVFEFPSYYKVLESGICIFYTEEDPENNLKSDCRIVILKDHVTIKKTGSIYTTMDFLLNEPTKCRYKTSFGNHIFEIIASNIEYENNKNGLELLLDYSMKNDSNIIGTFSINITVRLNDK